MCKIIQNSNSAVAYCTSGTAIYASGIYQIHQFNITKYHENRTEQNGNLNNNETGNTVPYKIHRNTKMDLHAILVKKFPCVC